MEKPEQCMCESGPVEVTVTLTLLDGELLDSANLCARCLLEPGTHGDGDSMAGAVGFSESYLRLTLGKRGYALDR